MRPSTLSRKLDLDAIIIAGHYGTVIKEERTKKREHGEECSLFEKLLAGIVIMCKSSPMQQSLSWVLSRKAKQAHAVLWLGVFLLLQAVVVLPGLHALIHSDASDPDHQCAVTLFTHGQVHGADAAVPVVRPEPLAVFISSWHEASFVSIDVRLLPVRGPPSLLSLPS
jgi:hypothetical protein